MSTASAGWERRWFPSIGRALTLAGALAVAAFGRVGPDWPAQDFRAWLARNAGLVAWNDAWYAGHPLPGYSVLFPPMSAALGAGLTGLVAVLGCAWAAARLVRRCCPALSAGWRLALNGAIAVSVLGNFIIGQVPFLLGVAAGLCALVALHARRPVLLAVLAALSSLASPLAGLFLLLVGIGWLPEIGWRRVAPLATAGVGGAVAVLVGGSVGAFPFDAHSAIGIGAFTVLAGVLVPRSHPGLRRFVLVNALAGAALWLIPNPVGGNLARLGQLIAVPLGVWFLATDDHHRWPVRSFRPALVGGMLLGALSWQLAPVTSAIARSSGDPSSSAGYYTGLLGFLKTQNVTLGRLEIPFTREHWEADFVATQFPLARGWERQLDVAYDDVLYHPLTAASYRSWLDASAVDLVALPHVPLDAGGVPERTLLAHPPSYLQVVYRDSQWTVWKVLDPTPLLSGADARLLSVGPSSFTVQFRLPGTATIRLHASPLWQTPAPATCFLSDADGWLHLRSSRAQTLTVTAEVTWSAVLHESSPSCGAAAG